MAALMHQIVLISYSTKYVIGTMKAPLNHPLRHIVPTQLFIQENEILLCVSFGTLFC